jgi:hypothetical protein
LNNQNSCSSKFLCLLIRNSCGSVLSDGCIELIHMLIALHFAFSGVLNEVCEWVIYGLILNCANDLCIVLGEILHQRRRVKNGLERLCFCLNNILRNNPIKNANWLIMRKFLSGWVVAHYGIYE